ncbi:YciI family protein [Cellulomonas endophytica]|uniref:YciI family protein n=1 Tax=Cellulomonas endophytica TaxID=2494735 RepID=UPI0010133D9A|nr:YciI family protein [Cellulomonas endophytica]
MQFVLFICTDPTGEPYDETADDVGAWFTALQERGTHLAGDRLRPVEDATTVRVRGGERLVTDGPFAETREWIAGFDVIEVADLDEALEVAAAHPMARFGRIEVRPVWPL